MKDKLVYPTPIAGGDNSVITLKEFDDNNSLGITLREHYAGLAMQGLLSNPQWDFEDEDLAKNAFRCADALIKELEK